MLHVACCGNPYEMGRQQGEQARERIRKSVDVLRGAEAFRMLKPPLVPMPLFLWLSRRKAEALVRPDVEKHYPDQAERIRGIAAGSGIDERFLYLGLSVELLMAKVDVTLCGCSAAGVTAPRAGEPIIAKNFDYPELFRPLAISRHNMPANGHASLDVTVAPLAGNHDGINEHGLVVCYNYGYGRGTATANAPITLLVQELLERCRTTREAVDRLRAAKWAGAALLLIGDAEGDLLSVEMAPGRMETRGPEDGVVINTNHYLTEALLSADTPHNAYYSQRSVTPLRGQRLHESSERRLDRLRALFAGRRTIERADLEAIFRDHGDGAGDNFSPCRHADYFTTTCSVVFLPRQRRMFLVDGHPCQEAYREISFTGQTVGASR